MNVSEDGDAGVASSYYNKNELEKGETQGEGRGGKVCAVFFSAEVLQTPEAVL